MEIPPSKLTFQQFHTICTAIHGAYEVRRYVAWLPSWLPVWLPVALLVMLPVAVVYSRSPGQPIALAICILLLPFGYEQWRKNKRKDDFDIQFRLFENFLDDQKMTVEATGIFVTVAEGGMKYTYEWRAFDRFVDLPEGFLFVRGMIHWVYIPKLDVSDEDQVILRSWIPAGLIQS